MRTWGMSGRFLGRRTAKGAGACAVACLVLAACGGGEPTPDMTRSAALVLGQSVAQGAQLGECLQAAGYDVDHATVARGVEAGPAYTGGGRKEKTYDVVIDGPEKVSLTVLYTSALVFETSDKDRERLTRVGCPLDG